MRVDSAKRIAKGKGVHREVEGFRLWNVILCRTHPFAFDLFLLKNPGFHVKATEFFEVSINGTKRPFIVKLMQ
ncbi:MAG: hypothetical protein PHR65_07275 [Syntrophomonadaceae bacterium]|nr:hypothetical protein [Syntrophomonadaceae bacterium]